MQRRIRWLIGAALALALVGAAVGVGLATNGGSQRTEPEERAEGGDSDAPLVGSDRERAAHAALTYVGGGTVTEVEAGDDGAAYGVEIRRDDGSQVEVQLDASFTVTGTEEDDD
jgi:uncharacterized membrane protein YkoI